MNPNLTDTLCTQCGLCCDGSMFADVELGAGALIQQLASADIDSELLDQFHRCETKAEPIAACLERLAPSCQFPSP